MRRLLPFLLLALPIVACDCGDEPDEGCLTSADCDGDATCVDGRCIDRAGPDASTDGCAPCGGECCGAGEVCEDDACVPTGPACAGPDDCSDDSRCTGSVCVPWGDGSADPTCNQVIVPGTFAPTVQCELSDAPAGDPFPEHMHVLSTPMVVDFGGSSDPDSPPRPSIVAVFDDGVDGSSEQPTGVIRILDGRTCTQTAELGSLQLVSHSSPPAVADLDGDRRPEIVAFKANGGLVAFTADATGTWSVLWRSTLADGTPYDPTGGGWAGPSIADLDDDGVPEVMRQGLVFDANGVLLDDSLAGLTYGSGVFPVVADVDGDGLVEHVQGDGAWEWREGRWNAETWSAGGTAAGHVALADFGAYPGTQDWSGTSPEVAVVSAGTVRIQTLDGTTVFGPVAIPGGGNGGPPTLADFDGDGLPEVSSAGAVNYVVFDPDCGTAREGSCASGRDDGVLWTQPSQDQSSNVTGSSVFDFEADGRAEVVYGDECFLRVYDGETGDVVFSQFRTSCTWYENPVIADVDGDFNAEIVIGNNFNCSPAGTTDGRPCAGLGPRQTDPLHAGLRCDDAGDCPSGTCDAGFCRCTDDTQCCLGAGCEAAGYVCEAPPEGTPGTGNTCRASHPRGTRGIRVYGDTADRWVNSRRIWNQHAYHVTNVDPYGTVPRSSEAALNWLDPELNDFRKNVQGDAIPGAAPDITSRTMVPGCSIDGGTATLRAQVCNRGSQPVGDGLAVGFYAGEPGDDTRICQAFTETVLGVGSCATVECIWDDPPTTAPGVDITVVADDDEANGECAEGNNRSTLEGVVCMPVE